MHKELSKYLSQVSISLQKLSFTTFFAGYLEKKFESGKLNMYVGSIQQQQLILTVFFFCCYAFCFFQRV